MLRLLRFRPEGAGSVLDAALRDEVAPRLAGMAGLRNLYLGRRGPDESGERLIVSVWESRSDLDAALGPAAEAAPRAPELAAGVADPTVEVLPIVVDLSFDQDAPPGILRVFRGEVRSGLREDYVADVRTGTERDAASGTGPLALLLGLVEPSGFVTVSVWTDWDVIQAATGSNLRRPVATRHANRLAGGTAAHYEVLPQAAAGPPPLSPAG